MKVAATFPKLSTVKGYNFPKPTYTNEDIKELLKIIRDLKKLEKEEEKAKRRYRYEYCYS